MWVWVLRGWSVLSTTRPPPVTRSALPTWAPLSPAQLEPRAAATHQLILIETPSTQHQPGPGPGSQAAVCDGGDFTTHLSCFTASSGLGADALCVFANLLTTLHTTQYADTSDTAFFPVDCLLGNHTCRSPPFLGFFKAFFTECWRVTTHWQGNTSLEWRFILPSESPVCVCRSSHKPPAL